MLLTAARSSSALSLTAATGTALLKRPAVDGVPAGKRRRVTIDAKVGLWLCTVGWCALLV
jgi:hypothetical protein